MGAEGSTVLQAFVVTTSLSVAIAVCACCNKKSDSTVNNEQKPEGDANPPGFSDNEKEEDKSDGAEQGDNAKSQEIYYGAQEDLRRDLEDLTVSHPAPISSERSQAQSLFVSAQPARRQDVLNDP